MSEAVWYDGRCSWMGAVADPATRHRAEYRALGPNVYGGTAGIGLFLAQLGAVTGEPAVCRTALGALRHAVGRAASLPFDQRDGFHAGLVGISWSAARAAALLGEEEIHAGGREAMSELPERFGPDRCPDVVKGSAGSIVGLLALAAAYDDERLVQDAVVAGDALLERATVDRYGWSWPLPAGRRVHHLCGAAHGAGGIGWSLLELFAATGEGRFRVSAEGAFAYERSWLDANSGTWPDLRIAGQRRGAPREITSSMTGTWCHGEAGIALTRLRAIAVLGSGPHGDDAEVALETTRGHLAGVQRYEIEDLSLCHGAAGAADTLLVAANALGGRWRPAADLAADLGRILVERHVATDVDWPCATLGTTPDLFLGLGGIAWLFLRLHDPTIQSPLLLPMHG